MNSGTLDLERQKKGKTDERLGRKIKHWTQTAKNHGKKIKTGTYEGKEVNHLIYGASINEAAHRLGKTTEGQSKMPEDQSTADMKVTNMMHHICHAQHQRGLIPRASNAAPVHKVSSSDAADLWF